MESIQPFFVVAHILPPAVKVQCLQHEHQLVLDSVRVQLEDLM